MKKALLVLFVLILIFSSACTKITASPTANATNTPTAAPSTEVITLTPTATISPSPSPSPTAMSTYSPDYTIEKVTFKEKEIAVEYIRIANLNNDQKQKKLNDMIKNFVFKNVDLDHTYNFTTECSYEVKYKSADLISVVFNFYQDMPVHPSLAMSALNISIRDEKIITLTDIITVDNRIADKLLNRDFKLYDFEGYEIEDTEVYDEIIAFHSSSILETLQDANMQFYITPEVLGISLITSHVYGDHVEFEIAYSQIPDLIKPGSGLPPQEYILYSTW